MENRDARWGMKKLSDFANITMGQSPSSEFYNKEGKGYPFLQGNRTFGYKYPIYDTWTTQAKKIAHKGDVIMSVRAPVGDLNIAPSDLCLGRGVCSLSMKNGNNDYLFYLLKANLWKILSKENGTIFASVNRTDLENLEFDVPPIVVQNKIAMLLNRIDKKIQTNNSISELLYEKLNLLYKKYIDDNDDSDVRKIGDIIDIKGGYSYSSQHMSSDENDAILITMGNAQINRIFNFDNMKFYKPEKDLSKYKLGCGDLFISTRDVTQLRNQLGCPGLIPDLYKGKDIYAATNVYRVEQKIKDFDLRNFMFLVMNSEGYRRRISENAKGSAVLMITKDDILDYRFKFPKSIKYLEKFIQLISPFFRTINKNIIENVRLAELRDTLLPKLMSGEIDVDAIEL